MISRDAFLERINQEGFSFSIDIPRRNFSDFTSLVRRRRISEEEMCIRDRRKVVVDHLSDFSLSDIQKPLKSYTANLKEIITKARKDNPHLPIYVVGIYNPLYLNFPELTSIQTAVDRWNETTEETIAQFDQVYFVPINDLLYKGIDGKMGVSEISDGKTTVINDALYEEDSFHPNNTGYEKMKQAILEKINATKKTWSQK